MIPLLLLGGIALAGGIAIGMYWKNIAGWLKKIWEKLPPSIKQQLQGAVALAQKVASVFKNIMKYYSYDSQTKKWQETVVTTEVNESEIPEHIRSRLQNSNQVDISTELQEKLELAL